MTLLFYGIGSEHHCQDAICRVYNRQTDILITATTVKQEKKKDWGLASEDGRETDRKDLVFLIWPIDLELMRWQQ